MKKKIILHGYLRDLYDQEIEVEAETIAEAMRSLQHIPELAPKNGLPYPVTIKGVESEIQLFAQSDMTEVHVFPQTTGAGGKNGALTRIIIGITLIAVAIFAPTMIAPLAEIGITKGMIIMTGLSLTVGGLIQMLMPQPEEDKTQSSKYLGGNTNSVAIGTRIPLVYGARKIPGHFLSFDVDAKDIAVEATGDETYEGAYVTYDKTPIADGIVPLLPIYASKTPSATNVPTSDWRGY